MMCVSAVRSFFIHLLMDTSEVALHNLTVIDSAVLNIMGAVSFESVSLFLWLYMPKVKLQDHIVVLLLVF